MLIKDKDLCDFISIRWYLTGMIEIPCDEGAHCGTCFVQKIERFSSSPCPCPECRDSGSKQWGKVTVSTALHVIKILESDAHDCTVRLFYDSSDSEGKKLHFLKSHSHDEEGDWCALTCVIHDLDLLDRLEEKLKEHWELGHSLKENYGHSDHNLVVIISHPHGGPKRLSIGEGKVKDLAREVRDGQDWCYYSYDAATCDGSSGSPVYVLGQWIDGYGYWFGHGHNHSGVDINGHNSSTVGVDSTYSYSSSQQV